MIQISQKIDGRLALLVAGLVCLFGGAISPTAQAQILFRGQQLGGSETELTDANLATLQTDPDLESTLEQAKRFQDDGNFRVATKLMQLVLEQSGAALFSDDEITYYSLVRQVERQLAALPAEGLAAYRLEADAEARAIISAGEQSDLVNALNEVVSRYFISSVGDEAAVRLGRLYLDQYDFVSARRVFEKALQHPDLSVDKNLILSHIALCDLFLNDLKTAKKSTQQLLEDQSDLRLAQLIANEIDDINSGKGSINPVQRHPTSGWEMPLASSSRYGVGLPVDERMLGDELVAAFQYYDEINFGKSKLKSKTVNGNYLSGDRAYGKSVEETFDSFEKRMISARQKNGWRPTGMLLFGPDQVYVKTARDMLALKKSELPIDPRGSKASTLDPSMTSWRSLWTNTFAIDAGTVARNRIIHAYRNALRPRRGAVINLENPTPTSKPEVQTYGDSIAAQFSIYNGVLYSIEGAPDNGMNPIKNSRHQQNDRFGHASYTRSRDNFLVAYDLAQEGKVLWTLPRSVVEDDDAVDDVAVGEEKLEKFLRQGGLMGAPVGYQNTIIAPVNVNGSIWIYGFDPNTEGATLWKSHLCDEPTSGAYAWSAINLSVDGSDVLVSCGLGVVFVLDAANGQIRIARRYERSSIADPYLGIRRWPGPKKMVFNKGWSSDTIIPYGRQMICFCSDAKVIESIDRETGRTLWKNEFDMSSRRLDYLLGVYDGVLYLAGPKTIAAYDLNIREHIWGGDDLFDGDLSLGKGVLTPQGIFVPARKKILQFDLLPKKLSTQPKPIRKISVDLGGDSLGNLFSDGDRFWVHGGNRIYALEPKPE